jgi:hypothetical protein
MASSPTCVNLNVPTFASYVNVSDLKSMNLGFTLSNNPPVAVDKYIIEKKRWDVFKLDHVIWANDEVWRDENFQTLRCCNHIINDAGQRWL